MGCKPGYSYAIVALIVGVISKVNAELTPPYFNLAEGRRIHSTATCGVDTDGPELFCKLVGANTENESNDFFSLLRGQVCDMCDPSDASRNHPPQNAIDGTEQWWQSPPLSRGMKYNEVNLTIDFGQEFHVAYVFIRMGNSPRPGAFSLEKSMDHGKTWTAWQHFSDSPSDCETIFKGSVRAITRDDDVICTTEYSKIVPLENGEIPIMLLNNRPSANNYFNSTVLQEWTRATNIRIRLIRTKNLLGHLMSVARQDPSVTRRYFYSIKDVSIGGRCMCNGHADTCHILDTQSPNRVLACQCQHNTCGIHCAECCPGFEQKKWKQNTNARPFRCEPCNCHGHTSQCRYDEEVDRNGTSLDIHGNYEGGGVCQHCQHNTMGINCNQCTPKYYRPRGRHWNETDVCEPCNCDRFNLTGNCAEETGACECRKEYLKPNCDDCAYGYYGYPHCKPCDCHLEGTDGYQCQPEDGQCSCKANFAGHYCERCADGYFNYPECVPCQCNDIGSVNDVCHERTGVCQCKSNFAGSNCEICKNGYFNYPTCSYCNCDIRGTLDEVCDQESGQCLCREGFGGPRCDQCISGFYNYPDCVPCNCSTTGSASTSCDASGKCHCLNNFAGRQCNLCSAGYYQYPECLPCSCDLHGSTGVSCNAEGQCFCNNNFDGKNCQKCKEGYYNYPTCEECNCDPAGVASRFGGCGSVPLGELCQCKSRATGRICNQCKPLYWNLTISNPEGCQECDCFVDGTVGALDTCDFKTGQCACKPTVGGRTCDQCADGMFDLFGGSLFGCKDCGCDIGGSVSDVCDKRTGQCRCHPRITGRTCNYPLTTYYYPTVYQYQYEYENGRTPAGAPARFQKDQIIFPEFSGKGYAHFSQLMHEVENEVTIFKSSVYRMIIRYHNTMQENIVGTITIQSHNPNEADQVEKVLLKPTERPQFVTVSGTKGDIPWPLVLDPGRYKFVVKIDKQVFLDYFVLLPAAYYEASVLTKKVENPCEIGNLGLCRHFKYPSIAQFNPSYKGIVHENGKNFDPNIFYEDYEHLEGVKEKELPALSEDQMTLSYILSAPKSGRYHVVIDYITERSFAEADIIRVSMSGDDDPEGVATIYPCYFTMTCRQPVVDEESREKVFHMNAHETRTITLKSEGRSRIGIKSVTVIPVDSWSLDYINPSPVAVIQDGRPVKGRFSMVADSKRVEFEADHPDRVAEKTPVEMFDNSTKLVYLNKNDSSITITARVNNPGRYILLVKYYNPDHPKMDLPYRIETDLQNWEGKLKVAHCASNIGCRMIIDHDGSVVFDIDGHFTLSLTNNENNGIWLDFILLVPFEVFHDNLLVEESFDQTKEFLQKCGNDHFHIPMNASDFCKQSVFSITADHNNGALYCGCNVDGSTSLECDPFGGQCQCKENVINRECNECLDNYYDFPNCKKCDCPFNARCHPVTGECICPDGVIGEKCDQCAPLTFGFDSLTGCEDCNCNPLGVYHDYMQCDLNNGSCACKPNVVGRHCDQCERGYYNFPYCEPCSCDPRGTTFEICDQSDAACHCKKNVVGRDCQQCAEGTFNLQDSNPEGCTKCFCFGKTTRCSSAYLRPFNVSMIGEDTSINTITMEHAKAVINRWAVATGAHRVNETMLQVREFDEKEGLVYFGMLDYLLDTNNHLTAYGGKLTYKILYSVGLFGKSLIGPDVILEGKNEVFVHQSYEQPANGIPFRGSVEMIESNFQTISGLAVTRDQFMTLLRDLKGIFIRANYWEQTVLSQLSDVYLTMADQDRENYNLYEELPLEVCQCPAGYVGNSCENCAPGFYRDPNGPHGGYCIPCQCNGHAATCDCNTGVCEDCQHGTTGEHCEMCIEGYYGNATMGTPYDCMICACPLPIASNNFAHSCEVSDGGNLISCNCREGYTGATCSACAAGFYGDPRNEGEVCRPCQCSGNIDPRHPDSCDSLTGECKLCLNNTAGTACNLCKPFFFGDAIMAKDCRSCDCDEMGSEFCDNTVGTCHCYPNVVGEKCDRCEDDHYGFESRRGCRACDCGAAAYSTQCEDQTGECRCKPGVTGRQCDRCAPGFFNYTSEGCVPCLCNTDYSRGLGCNPHTGQCECLPGVVGKNCDHCPHRWVLIPDTGCNKCDICHHALLDVTDGLRDKLDPVIADFKNAAGGYFTSQKLNYLNDMADQIEPDVRALDPKGVNLNPVNAEIDALEQEGKNFDRRLSYAQKNANELSTNAVKLVVDAQNVSTDCVTAHFNAQNAIRVVENLAESLESAELTRVDRAKSEAEQIVEHINEYSIDLEPAEKQRDAAESTWAESGVLKIRAMVPVKDLELLQNDTKTLQDRLLDMNELAKTANERSLDTEVLNAKNKAVTLNTKFETVGNHLKETSGHLDEGKAKLKETEQALKKLAENIKTLDKDNFDMKSLNAEVEEMLPGKEEAVDSKENVVRDAAHHADRLRMDAEELKEQIVNIESDSEQPLKAAQAYSNIVENVNQAQQAVQGAKEAARNATTIGDGIDQRAALTDQNSGQLLDDARKALDKVQVHLGPHLNTSRQSVNEIVALNTDSDNKLKQINAALEQLSEDPQTAKLEIAKETADASNKDAQKALKIMKPIVKSLAENSKLAQDLPIEMDKTSKDISQIRQQVSDVTRMMPNIENLVANLENRQNTTNLQASGLGEKLSKLREQVDNAREIANSINVGVKFHPNTTLELKTPENLPQLATNSKISTYFRTSKPNGFLVYLGNKEQPEESSKKKQSDFMALEVENGYPVLSVDLGYGPERLVSDKYVADDQWRQAIIERTGNNIQLTIREELDDQSVKEHQVNQTLPGPFNVFQLDKDSRLFVGGYPPDYEMQAGVKYSSFDGEIEELKVGDESVGLWNFVEGQSNSEGARERNKLVTKEKSPTGYRFNGNGYVMIDSKPFSFEVRSQLRFKFKATRDARDGLMFYAGKGGQFIAVEMREGKILYQFKIGQKLVQFISQDTYNDDKFHDLEITRDRNRGLLRVDNQDFSSEDTANGDHLRISDTIYFGGYPGKLNHSEVTSSGFDGCIDAVHIEGTPVDLTRNLKAMGTRRGCPVKFSAGVTFQPHKFGYVTQGNLTVDNYLQVTLTFRTKHEDGVLFYAANNDQSSTMGLALFEGQLYLTSQRQTITSKRLNDGESHIVTATHDSTSLRLDIDDVLHYDSRLPAPYLQINYGEVFFGGLPKNYRLAKDAMRTSVYFVGCISNVGINHGDVNFAESRDKQNAIFDNCPQDMFNYDLWTVPNYYPEDSSVPDIFTRVDPTNANEKVNEIDDGDEDEGPVIQKPTQPPRPITPRPKPKPTPTTTRKPWPTKPQPDPKTGCQLGHEKFDWDVEYDLSVGYRFGLRNESRIEIDEPSKRKAYDYYLEFKTESPDGLLFYASDARHTDFVALYLDNGRLVHRFKGGAGSVSMTSEFEYHNGEWHTVFFSRSGNKGSLMVDGNDEQRAEASQQIRQINIVPPMYLGGVGPESAEDLHLNLPNSPKDLRFKGCIRAFTVSNKQPKEPRTIDVSPCSEQVEPGAFFSGGFMRLREKLKVGTDIRIALDIKARTQNGLLLSVHGKKALLILQLLNGTVSFIVDNGDGMFETVFVPEEKNLCDGEWHSIVAIKTKFVITLQVDGVQSQPTIGPTKTPSADTSRALFLGGHQHITKIRGLKARTPYLGCIRNVKIDDKPEEMTTNKVTGDVLVGVCPTF